MASTRRSRRWAVAPPVFLLAGLVTAVPALGADAERTAVSQEAAVDVVPPGTQTVLNATQGGAWSWFEDERAIIDAAGSRLYASVTTGIDVPGTTRAVEMDMATGGRRIVDLGRAEVDDHNTAALWEAPNGEVLASWSRHGGDGLQRQFRRLVNGRWMAQPAVQTTTAVVTYNNLYSVRNGAVLYNFFRDGRNDPHAYKSTDGGRTWTLLGRLLRDPEDRVDRWPYVRYTSNGVDRIDFIATPSHPRQTATEIYHGFIRDDVVYRSDGTPLGPVGSSIDVTRLTLVWAPPNEQTDGWGVDVATDPATGFPVATFVRNISFTDNRYYYARWDGTAWDVDHVAYAGRSFYDPERHYTGLAAIDPNNVASMVISTDADPVTGTPLVSTADGQRHWELFRGTRRPDGGFNWVPMTANSSVDNIRPIWTASPSGASALLWVRGRYTTFLDYGTAIVGIVRRADGSIVQPGPVAPPEDHGDAQVVAGNFDNHGTDDLLLYRPGSGPEELRLFDLAGGIARVPLVDVATTYQPVVGDFTGDTMSDIFWYAPGVATDVLWRQVSSAFVPETTRQVSGTYRPLVGDFDGDGDADIYWYAPGPAPESVWLAQGTGFRTVATRQVGGTYTTIVGDFDGSGSDDIFWYAPGPAADSTWYTRGGVFYLDVHRQISGQYVPVAGNFDAANGDDIYWYSTSGPDPVWLSTNSRFFRDSRARDMGAPPPGGHRPIAGDFTGRGGTDVLWFTPSGPDTLWASDNGVFSSTRQFTL